jgi:hypothetical protein
LDGKQRRKDRWREGKEGEKDEGRGYTKQALHTIYRLNNHAAEPKRSMNYNTEDCGMDIAGKVFQLIRAIQLGKEFARTHGHSLGECYKQNKGSRLLSNSGWRVYVRTEPICSVWNSHPHPKKMFSNQQTALQALTYLSDFLSLFSSLWRPHARQDFLLFHPTVQSCDVGLSKSPCSAGQGFKGSGSCFSISGASLKVRKFCGLVWISLFPTENLVCQSLHTCQHK